MKKFFFLPVLFMLMQTESWSQDTCISAPLSLCIGDCAAIIYTGSAPSSATYTWTSSCGTFEFPNQQNPGMHCFLSSGLCTLQVIIEEPGLMPDTCEVLVEVHALPDGIIGNDTTICSGSCVPLYINFSAGTPPFVYQVDDGFITNFYTSFGFSDTILICPIFTTSYTLAAITDGNNCQNPGPLNSVTVVVQPSVTASITQSGNMLCANPPNQNYEWWDCGYTQLYGTSQCITITQDGCYCLIVSDGGVCADTVCGGYILPCDLTCEILLNDSLCIGDSVLVTYSGNASSNAIFNWMIELPGMQDSSFIGNDTISLAYDQAGCYDISVIVSDGNCATTCSDSVCVFSPASEASFGPDILACDTCTTIYISLSGISPWDIILSDGVTQYNINGVTFSPFPFVVCIPQDSTVTYTLVSVTDSLSICPAVILDDSVNVTLLAPLIASVTQNGNVLCADTIEGSYAWYDCGLINLLSTDSCLTITASGCYCLIVDNGMCQDTLCAEYIATPCELTCEIIAPDRVCIGDSVTFVYSGNANANATFNWLIDLPGSPATPFSGNDTVLVGYDQVGCYAVQVTLFDNGCIVTCSDSVCVVGPTSEASICCNRERCDTCTMVAITLSGASPWTVYLFDGSSFDTIPGITDTFYLHEVCPPLDSTVIYSIQVIDSNNICPVTFPGDSSVSITLHGYPEASIMQNVDTLCANPPGMAGYGWYSCPAGAYLSTNQCFVPPSSGCYCVDVSTEFDCVDTACFNFIISATGNIDLLKPKIYPVPSKGTWQILLPEDIVLPVDWNLIDVSGRTVDSGSLTSTLTSISLSVVPPAGMYYIRFVSGKGKMMTAKVVIE
jgi:hypothetical protein